MKVQTTALDEIFIVAPRVFTDQRGYFMETFHADRYRQSGIDRSFVQDNISFSTRGTLRGLHFQVHHPQGKLVQAVSGEVFDVAVDVRPGSPTFGRWTGALLSEHNKRQMYIPEGFAHGFCVLSPAARFLYKCTDFYDPEDEGGIIWSDPMIGIEWPIKEPFLSDKDKQLPRLSELSPQHLPRPKKDLDSRSLPIDP